MPMDPPETPCVLLVHGLPGGTSPVDWLGARSPSGGPDERALLAFRLPSMPAWTAGERFGGVRMADHRGRYLVVEGPLGGGRGSVRRVARGVCRFEADDDQLAGQIDLGAGPLLVAGRRVDAGRPEPAWSFTLAGG